jgi:hypothetical protein
MWFSWNLDAIAGKCNCNNYEKTPHSYSIRFGSIKFFTDLQIMYSERDRIRAENVTAKKSIHHRAPPTIAKLENSYLDSTQL